MDWIFAGLRRLNSQDETPGTAKEESSSVDPSSTTSTLLDSMDSLSGDLSSSVSDDDVDVVTTTANRPRYATEETVVARDVATNKRVQIAMKDLRYHSSGVFSNVYRGVLDGAEPQEIVCKKTFPKSARQNTEMLLLSAMRRSRPANIIPLLYAYHTTKHGDVCECFIFPYLPQSLDNLIRHRRGERLNQVDVKIYTWQLFNGLDFLYHNMILHRDIKPDNIMIDHDKGLLQIADFGSSKVIDIDEKSTAYQVTRFYRAPELLLGCMRYDGLVDVWSAGCVVGEMLKGRVLFAGRDSADQLRMVIDCLGPPPPSFLWEMNIAPATVPSDMVDMPIGRPLEKHLPSALPEECRLLYSILAYTPRDRLCGERLLQHSFFSQVLSDQGQRANGQKTAPLLQRQNGSARCFYPYKEVIKRNRGVRTPIIPSPAASLTSVLSY